MNKLKIWAAFLATALLLTTALPVNAIQAVISWWLQDCNDRGCQKTSSNPQDPCTNCKSSHGMPQWWVSEPYINLWLDDQPAYYQTSLGQEFGLHVFYKQRDTRPANGVSTNTFYRDGTSKPAGPWVPTTGWNNNWFSYIHFGGLVTNGSTGADFSQWIATVYYPGGGEGFFCATNKTDVGTGVGLMPMDGVDQDIYPTSANPATIAVGGSSSFYGAVGFRMVYPDGSQDLYGTVTGLYNNGYPIDPAGYPYGPMVGQSATINAITGSEWTDWASFGTNITAYLYADAILTEHIEANGNTTKFLSDIYIDAFGNTNWALLYVVDPDGQTNKLLYDTNHMLEEVDMPYGRSCVFSYSGVTNLTSIQDANGMTSSLSYDTNGYVTNLTTPYGATYFSITETNPAVPGTSAGLPAGNVAPGPGVDRSIVVTLPDLSHEMYIYAGGTGVPCSIATNFIPGNTPFATLDCGTNSSDPYRSTCERNTFYWNARQFAALSTGDPYGLTNTDFLLARRQHWLVDVAPADQANVLSGPDGFRFVSEVPSLVQEPSPDGTQPGNIIWFDYPDKAKPSETGSELQPCVVAQLLSDGSTQYEQTTYGAFERPTSHLSTFTQSDGSVGTRTYTFSNYVQSGSQTASYSGTTVGSNVFWHWPVLAGIAGPGGTNLLQLSAPVMQTNTTTNIVNFFPLVTSRTFVRYPELDITNGVNQVLSLFYNSRSQLAGYRLPAGLVVTNLYGTNGFLAQSMAPEIERTNSFVFANGLPAVQTNELGLVLNYTWDALDRLTGISFPDATYVSNVYTNLDLAGHRDRLGKWTTYAYDSLEHLTNFTDANSNTTQLTWCDCGSLTSIIDPLHNTNLLYYDYQGRLTNISFADTSSITYQYDTADRLTTISDGSGAFLQKYYDNQGMVTQLSNAVGVVSSATFDIYDRPATVTSSEGVVVNYNFDLAGRLLGRTWAADGIAETFGYNTNGLTAYTNRDGHWTHFGRDSLGRLRTSTNANLEVTLFSYDAANNLTNLTDGASNTTTWNYNQFGWVTNKIDPTNNQIFVYSYDAKGRLTNRFMLGSGNTGYAYNAVGNLTNITYSNTPTAAVGFGYDPGNNLTSMVDAIGRTAWTYTSNNQVATETGPWTSNTVSYTYNQRHRATLTLLQPTGGAWQQTNSYDNGWRLTGLSSPAGAFGYGYLPSSASRLIQSLGLPNAAFITNEYDSLARLTNTSLINYWGHVLDGYGYAYDYLGLRTGVSRYLGITSNNITAGYDNIGQLLSWTGKETGGASRLNEQLSYAYDAADNLQYRTNSDLTQTFAVDTLNQLSTITRGGVMTVAGNTPAPTSSLTVNGVQAQTNGDFTFAATNNTLNRGTNLTTFTVIAANANGVNATNIISGDFRVTVDFTNDLNGNLISDGTRSFVYDAENQLTNVYVTNLWKSEFVYDGLRRKRIEKDYTWTGSAWAQTNETHLVYDGMLPIQERASNNAVQVTYTRGLDLSGSRQDAGGIGGLLARADANGSTFYHSDGSGNITALIDATQNIVARYEYNPFGKLIGKWGALADVNRYRFSSKEIHPLSGLYSYGFRFYEPSFQRWLNRDPIGEGGGLNLSQFVGNSPVNEIDPLGLEGNPVSSTLPGVSGSWNSDAYGPGGSFYDPGNGWRPPVGNAMNPQDVRDQIMGELNPPPFPYPPSWPYPDGANGWDPNTGQWLYPSEGLQIDPIMEAIALSAAASLRGATLRPCPPVKAAIKPAGSLVSSSVRAFLRGEKALSELSAAEKEQAIRGFEQAAEDARDAADAAYQRARAAALRGEGPPPGSLQQWRQNYGQK